MKGLESWRLLQAQALGHLAREGQQLMRQWRQQVLARKPPWALAPLEHHRPLPARQQQQALGDRPPKHATAQQHGQTQEEAAWKLEELHRRHG